jgi:hypothetical protein
MVRFGIPDSLVFVTMDPPVLLLVETSVMAISWTVAYVSKIFRWS